MLKFLRVCIVVYRLQGQVDEVVDVMQDNIGRVLDRGDKLEDLQDKSGMKTIAHFFIVCVITSGNFNDLS